MFWVKFKQILFYLNVLVQLVFFISWLVIQINPFENDLVQNFLVDCLELAEWKRNLAFYKQVYFIFYIFFGVEYSEIIFQPFIFNILFKYFFLRYFWFLFFICGIIGFRTDVFINLKNLQILDLVVAWIFTAGENTFQFIFGGNEYFFARSVDKSNVVILEKDVCSF